MQSVLPIECTTAFVEFRFRAVVRATCGFASKSDRSNRTALPSTVHITLRSGSAGGTFGLPVINTGCLSFPLGTVTFVAASNGSACRNAASNSDGWGFDCRPGPVGRNIRSTSLRPYGGSP